MTPKEMSEALIAKFRKACGYSEYATKHNPSLMERVVRCSIAHCDIMILEYEGLEGRQGRDFGEKVFWQQVKSLIE